MERLGSAWVLVAACLVAPPSWARAEARASDPADSGFLDVASDPPAKIAIDGADTGQVTPQPHMVLKSGHHKLTLVTLDGKRSRSVGFTVQAGQTFTIHLAL